ncbi:MAG: GTP cyclohydrolase FolE2 [Verrucomicrobiales bacterium]
MKILFGSTMQLEDTQNSHDSRNLPIDRVGVRQLRFPLRVRDRDHNVQSTVATVALTVDLPHHFKGTHMSRFVEVLNSHGRLLDVDNVKELCQELKNRLAAEEAHVQVEFPYFMEKSAPATGAVGLMDYVATFDATLGPKDFDLVTTVKVGVTTLCPCSKAISTQGAHNQRGEVRLSVRAQKLVWIEELIEMVESSASSELYSLLKRPDEKVVTEKAYDSPVFVEDLVRAIAIKVSHDPRISWYRVEAENFESIHNHNAYALIEMKEGELHG